MSTLFHTLYISCILIVSSVIGAYFLQAIEITTAYILLGITSTLSLFSLYLHEVYEQQIRLAVHNLKTFNYKTWFLNLLASLTANLSVSIIGLCTVVSLFVVILYDYDLISYGLAMSVTIFNGFAGLYLAIIRYFRPEIIEGYSITLSSKIESLFSFNEKE